MSLITKNHTADIGRNASLIHDDVVDESSVRRGYLSVNARWSNKYAILTGDYLFSKSLICATKTKNFRIDFKYSTDAL